MSFTTYVENLAAQGKCCFSIDQAMKDLQKSRKAVRSSIEHLLKRKALASPAKGFYVILPPENRDLGCIPAEQFIPYLMEYKKLRYYAGLLTAARFHGATHQAVQVFQVMVEKKHLPISCGKVQIEFIVNKYLDRIPVQLVSNSKSFLTISTPEATAMDLFKYPIQSGGLNHIATVLTELHESMDEKKLKELIDHQPELAWKQRLGFVLEILGLEQFSNIIKQYLKKQRRINYIQLLPNHSDYDKNKRHPDWKIIENIEIESDI